MTGAEHAPDVGIPARRADVEWVELDGEAVLYDPRARTLHRLSACAAAVWAACDGTVSPERITRAIEDAYSGPRGAIARDVPATIGLFRRLSLLQQPPAEAGGAG